MTDWTFDQNRAAYVEGADPTAQDVRFVFIPDQVADGTVTSGAFPVVWFSGVSAEAQLSTVAIPTVGGMAIATLVVKVAVAG